MNTQAPDFTIINLNSGGKETFAALCDIEPCRTSGITFSALVEVLTEIMGVPSEGKSKFAARMRNFLRLGFPAVDSTKGKAVRFNDTHHLEFAIAMELTNLGFTPERAIQIIEFNRGIKRDDDYSIFMIDTFAIPPVWGNDRPYKVKLKMRRHWEAWP